MAKLTDFFDGAIGKANYSRLELWKDKVVIDRRGQVRFNQKVLIKLGKLPDEPRVLVSSSPNDKTLMFMFVSNEYSQSSDFRAIFKDRLAPYPYVFSQKTKKIHALEALRSSGIEVITNMIFNSDSETKKGMKAPHSIGFGDWEVDAEQKIVSVYIRKMEKRAKRKAKKKVVVDLTDKNGEASS